MKLEQLNEYEQQLDEASRMGAFKAVGSVFGLFGSALVYSAATVASITGSLPLAIVLGSLYGAYMGGVAALLVKGKQRTLYGKMMSLVKKRDSWIEDYKHKSKLTADSHEDDVKQVNDDIKTVAKLSEKIKKVAEELDDLVNFGKGGAGAFRRDISPEEKQQLMDVIKAGKGNSKNLLSFKYNIDAKKIK